MESEFHFVWRQVERAILVLCNMIANAFDWTEISQMVKEAQVEGDPVAKAIKALKLESNKFTFFLTYGHR